MTIKQLGGVFGRNPTFNDLDVDNNLTVSGDVSIEGTTDAKLVNIDLDAEAKGVVIKKNGLEIGSLRILDNNKLAIAGEGSTFPGFCFNNNGRIVPVYNGDRVDDAVDLGQSAGPLRFKNLYLSGNVIVASGNGIDFSATAGTGTSELFDDYEEGTWTPSTPSVTVGPTPGASASYTGKYTKIGNFVKAQITLDFDDSGTGVAVDDRFAVGNLPFVPVSSPYTASGNFWIYSSFGSGNNAFGTIGTATGGNTAAFYVTHIDGTLNYSSVLFGEFSYFT